MIRISIFRRLTGVFTLTALAFTAIFPAAAVAAPVKQRTNLARIKIVIDAGHGGHDPGAVGPTGLEEKVAALSIARYLADYLKKEKATVIMTRNGDKFIPLQRRAEIANKAKANRFVSVHLNAAPSRARNDTETYFHKMRAKKMAAIVQSKMFRQLEMPNNGIHIKRFAVIRWTKMPAILTEGSFISNPHEEARLKKATYRQKMAKAIFEGIMAEYGVKKPKPAVQVKKVVKRPVAKVEGKGFLGRRIEGFFQALVPPLINKAVKDSEIQLHVKNVDSLPFLNTIEQANGLTKLDVPIMTASKEKPVKIMNTSEKQVQPEIKLYDIAGRKIADMQPVIDKDQDFQFKPTALSGSEQFAGSMEIAAPKTEINAPTAVTITP